MHQLVIHIDGYIIIRAVNREYEMMPFIIGIIAVNSPFVFIIVEDERTFVEGEQRAFRIYTIHLASCGEDRSFLFLRFEPEHKCLVLLARAGKEVTVQTNRLSFLNAQGDTFPILPRTTIGVKGSAVGFVGKRLALAFVHRIVSDQFALVAGETLHIRQRNLFSRERFCPKANLHHVTRKAFTDANRCTGNERCICRNS